MKRSAHPEGRSHREAEAESNVVAEFEMNPLHPSSIILHTSYAWGYDLSATEQGAGGVGGLLLYRKTENGTPTTYSACADANGNLTAFLSMATATTGQVVGRNDYDPFGRRITSTLPTNFCPFGFSSKYTDEETDLAYYGYRYLSTELGRWLSRDPIGERGGINLYGMVNNDPVNKWDLLGMTVMGPFGSVLAAAEFGANIAAVNTEHQWNNPGVMKPWIAQREWGGSVCKCPKTGQIGITPPRTDDMQNSVVPTPCPEGWTRVGVYHSHPFLDGAAHQGEQDKENADKEDLISAMAQAWNPTGETYQGNSEKPGTNKPVPFQRPAGFKDPKNAQDAWKKLKSLCCKK